MKRNSRLSLALHALSHMAGEPERFWTSNEIAEHAGTNPVVVRRVLGKLRKAELLNAERGHSGGWQLAKAPSALTLADVYLALEESVVASSEPHQHGHCSVEDALHNKVAEVLDDVERTLVAQLRATSLKDVIAS